MEKSVKYCTQMRMTASQFKVCVLVLIFLCVFQGCGSIPITDYIPATHDPYKRKYYSEYPKVVNAVKDVLIKNGWTIGAEDDPSVYERQSPSDVADLKSIVLFTDVRSNWRLIYVRHTHMNIFIYASGKTTEVDVRYLSQIATVFKQFRRYRNDKLIKRILDQIELSLLVPVNFKWVSNGY